MKATTAELQAHKLKLNTLEARILNPVIITNITWSMVRFLAILGGRWIPSIHVSVRTVICSKLEQISHFHW